MLPMSYSIGAYSKEKKTSNFSKNKKRERRALKFFLSLNPSNGL